MFMITIVSMVTISFETIIEMKINGMWQMNGRTNRQMDGQTDRRTRVHSLYPHLTFESVSLLLQFSAVYAFAILRAPTSINKHSIT